MNKLRLPAPGGRKTYTERGSDITVTGGAVVTDIGFQDNERGAIASISQAWRKGKETTSQKTKGGIIKKKKPTRR